MLTEKDYCDYDTCVALKELGYKVPTSAYYMPNNNQLIFVSNPCRGGYVIDCFRSHNSFSKDVMTSNYIDAPTMWDVQKWLREEKGIDICLEVNTKNDRLSDKYYTVCISYMSRIKREYQYLNENFNSYEEALLDGIKSAIKLLKEEK